jgi:hypothetical protein
VVEAPDEEAANAPQAPLAEAALAPAPRREPPTKPAERPTVTRPAPVAEVPQLRPAPRLDLGEAAKARPEQVPPARSRFLRGLLLVLGPALLAFGAYRFGPEIAARAPAAAPALEAYGDMIDDVRDDIEDRIAEFRQQPGGS